MQCKISKKENKNDMIDNGDPMVGCNISLASQKDFLQKIVEEYIPYDYITSRSYKYEKFKKKEDIKLSKVKLKWVKNRFDGSITKTKEKLIAMLDPDGAPGIEELEKNLFDNWTSWVPIESTTVDLTLTDRQLENDIEVVRSPYRTTEKSVLTMMLPIKPFPLRDSDEERWNRFPSNKPPVYSKSQKPSGKRYYSMMHKYYASK